MLRQEIQPTERAQLVGQVDLALALLEAWDAERPVRREVALTGRITGQVPAALDHQLDWLTTRTDDLLRQTEAGHDERARLTAAQVRRHRQSLVRADHPTHRV